jgi:hypothetical protein
MGLALAGDFASPLASLRRQRGRRSRAAFRSLDAGRFM